MFSLKRYKKWLTAKEVCCFAGPGKLSPARTNRLFRAMYMKYNCPGSSYRVVSLTKYAQDFFLSENSNAKSCFRMNWIARGTADQGQHYPALCCWFKPSPSQQSFQQLLGAQGCQAGIHGTKPSSRADRPKKKDVPWRLNSLFLHGHDPTPDLEKQSERTLTLWLHMTKLISKPEGPIKII